MHSRWHGLHLGCARDRVDQKLALLVVRLDLTSGEDNRDDLLRADRQLREKVDRVGRVFKREDLAGLIETADGNACDGRRRLLDQEAGKPDSAVTASPTR